MLHLVGCTLEVYLRCTDIWTSKVQFIGYSYSLVRIKYYKRVPCALCPVPCALSWTCRHSAFRHYEIFCIILHYCSIAVQFLGVILAPIHSLRVNFNPLNAELNPICYLLALLGAHHFLHVSRIRVKSLTFRQLMSYIYGAPILDVSRSHTTTQHSR